MVTGTPTASKTSKLWTIVFFILIILIAGYVIWESRFFGVFADAKLEGIISVQENTLSGQIPGGILPGSQIKLSLKVTNTGRKPNAMGKVSIRFAKHKTTEKSQLVAPYSTEVVDLPAIAPDKSFDISFQKQHAWPTPQEYITQGWQDYEYQAIAEINNIKKIIGILPIGFHAYYQVGEPKELPATVPVLEEHKQEPEENQQKTEERVRNS